MASSPDMRLQLIIEAINRSESAFTRVKKDLLDVQSGSAAVTAASARAGQAMADSGNAGAAAMRRMGPAIAAARDHVAAAQKEMPGLLRKFAELKAHYDSITASGTASGKALEEAGKKGAAGMDHIHDRAQRAHSMLGQMVQMALIMGAALFAQKLTDAGVEYNKAMETSKLGLSAIMTSMGVITTQQGQVLQGQEKWNAAQSLSVQAQRDLERQGMLTAATYTELVEIYQGILAPALSAKMTFEETLDIAGLLTNAVKSIGLNTNQVKQEARDLIQGGISPASSSLAVALGITDAMVKKWREQGTLYQELKSRLNGFTYAANEFADTWEGAWSNFRDVASRALGEGSKPLFDFIKQEVMKLTGDMVNITRDASGKVIDIEVKPEVIARIRELAEDLKKLIQIMELTVKWSSNLAQPLMWGAIALGIGKVTLAIGDMYKAIKAGEMIARGSLIMRVATNPTAAAAVLALLGIGATAVHAYDSVQLSKRAEGIRGQFGKDGAALNIGQFQREQLNEVLKKFPTASDDDIVKMIRGGAIKLAAPAFTDRYSVPSYKVMINEKKGQQILDSGPSPFTLGGPSTTSDEELRKQQQTKRAGIEDHYRAEVAAVKRAETEKVEAIKTALKEKELLYQQGALSETEYLQAQAESQKTILQAGVDAAIAERKKLDEEWDKKKGTYDAADRSRAHAAYIQARGKLEEDQAKKEAELKRAGTDEEIKQLEQLRALETAKREGALKLLQEQLAAERQITQQLLEREQITPLEAEKRNIATDQSALEAEYWAVTARQMVGGLGEAARAELDNQLRLLEQRMETLSQQAPNRLYAANQATVALDAKREEARINHDLAELDAREQNREIGKLGALQQRKALLQDLLASQLDVQAAIDPGDTTAWNSQQGAIDATRQKLLELQLQEREISDDMAGGLMEGLQRYVDQSSGLFGQMVQLSTATAQAMEGAFSDFFFDAMQGKLKSFKDYFNAFLTAVQRQLANVMAQQVVMSGLSGLGITLQALGGAWEGGVQKFATGGIVLQPTLFPTATGLGLMGEAGPEAIMPLTRTASGHLGVRATSGGAGNLYVDLGGVVVQGEAGGVDPAQAAEFGRGLKAVVTQFILEQKRPGGLLY